MGTDPLFPLMIASRFHYGTLGIGLVYAAFPLSFVAASPFVGYLVDARLVSARVCVSE